MILENVKKYIFIIALLAIGGQMYASQEDNTDTYIKYSKEIMETFIKECEKQFNLTFMGTCLGFSYNMAEINFIAYRKGTLEEARTLEVKMTEALLERVNTHKKIRPLLSEYPFKPANTSISISYQKEDGSNYLDGSIAVAYLEKNNLFYYTANPKTEKLDLLLKEPYGVAVKIVNKSK